MTKDQKVKVAGVLLAWLACIMFGLQASGFVAEGHIVKAAVLLTLALGAAALAIHLRDDLEGDNS